MPYIRDAGRAYFDKFLDILHRSAISDPGELNFLLTQVIQQYHMNHSKNYQTVNDILGALEGAKQEYYRRVVIPYENRKISENSDVYTEEVLK